MSSRSSDDLWESEAPEEAPEEEQELTLEDLRIIAIPGVYNSEGEPLKDGEQIDPWATTLALHEWYEDGWRLVSTDLGLAYLERDLEVLASLMEDPPMCGTCAEFDGNWCTVHRLSADEDDYPMNEGCYVRRED